MSINTQKFGLASAITFAVLWIVCSVIVMLLPHQSMSVTGAMMHSDLAQWQWDMHFSGLVIGFFAWSLIAGITGWLLATIYNRLMGS